MPESHIESWVPRNPGTGAADHKPRYSKNIPKACSTRISATSPTHPAERASGLTQTGEMGARGPKPQPPRGQA